MENNIINIDIENILAFGIGIIIFAFIFLIAIYIVQGIVLNKLNKKIYGKGTALAWIPLCNTYLLGKLTVNKMFGFVLIIIQFFGANFIPEKFQYIYSIASSGLFIGLFVYAIIRLNKLGKGDESFVNEVYLNQKTKQEIMEEDEQVKLVKWDETEEQKNNVSETKQEENNIPFQSFVNTNEVVEETNNISLEENSNVNTEKNINLNIQETKDNLNIINEIKEQLPESIEKQDNIDEEYDYDNPKIQEAIDNIINKEN